MQTRPRARCAWSRTFNVVGDVNAADVYGPVLAHETSHAAHVVSVVAKLVAAETVDVGVEKVVDAGQTVQVLAVLALGADAAGEEEAEVGAGDPVGLRVAAVLCDITTALGGRLG